MTNPQEHAKRLVDLFDEMQSYLEFKNKKAMFQLLLEEFCGMNGDEALRTFLWLWEDPTERILLMIAINTEPQSHY